MKSTLVIVCSVLFLAGSASAVIVLNESFDYNVGDLDGQGSWANTGTGDVVVQNSSLSYTGWTSGGGRSITNNGATTAKAEKTGVPGVAALFNGDDPFYVGILVDNAGAGQWMVANLMASGVGELGGLYTGGYGTSDWRVMATVHNSTSGEPLLQLADASGTNLIAVMVDPNSTGLGVAAAKINPILASGEPVWSLDNVAVELSGNTIDHLMLGFSPDGAIDDLRVATTWDELVNLPEPATLAVLGVGGLLALLKRRRRA